MIQAHVKVKELPPYRALLTEVLELHRVSYALSLKLSFYLSKQFL